MLAHRVTAHKFSLSLPLSHTHQANPAALTITIKIIVGIERRTAAPAADNAGKMRRK